MLDDDTTSQPTTTSPDTAETPVRRTRRRAASRPAGPPEHEPGTTPATSPETGEPAAADADATAAPAKRTRKTAAKKTTAKKATKKTAEADTPDGGETQVTPDGEADKPAKKAAKKTPAKRSTKKAAEPTEDTSEAGSSSPFAPIFQAPDPVVTSRTKADISPDEGSSEAATEDTRGEEDGGGRRRRSRGGRNRRRSSDDGGPSDADEATTSDRDQKSDGKQADRKAEGKAEGKQPQDKQSASKKSGGKQADSKQADSKPADSKPDDKAAGSEDDGGSSGSSRRRRRRRRGGDDSPEAESSDTSAKARGKKESITSVEGSTRIEAKRQRRREGREAGRRRPPILSESEFLARRESVDRVMAIRQRGETTQIAVLEDNVLVEHYVALESQSSIIGNVYLGRVQNVLPSMEAAFIDIGKGRNAVLYAGEVNWSLRGDKNAPRRIENALKPGQSVLVQVSKDPIGHKGARLTSQISLPGRYLVYVPGGETSGISRKLPDTERNRLKNLLKEILPEDAGVIIRTAAEGASEEELTRDVTRLTARWDDIEKKSKNGQAPQLLYAEPDTTLKVVRDLFTEDFTKLVISGDDAWDMVDGYVQHVAPDLAERLEHHEGDGDVFANFRVDEQIAKALERKVWLPSGGSVVFDRTEAMTVVDVNTGKFTGSGGNLEETVTKNNLEAAEEIVRQLRLRDIGGIIVVDFIDMVLENNRDLVLRRLVECLGRDRTRHQVAEVTSLGLVQMTRKRISTGLLEAFSHQCDQCQGRGVTIEADPVEPSKADDNGGGGKSGSRGGSKRTSNRRRGGKKTADADGGDKESKDDKDDKPSEPKGKAAKAKDQSAPDTSGETPPAPSGGDGAGTPAGASPDGTPTEAPASTPRRGRSRAGRSAGPPAASPDVPAEASTS